nr:probable ATP-dependent RNA helicase DDX56 [Anser cygnoides]
MAAAFEHLGLDPRLLRAVSELGWAAPTAIQAQAIPAALEGRDLLARARTGSGKTAAYGLPLLQRLLRAAAPGAAAQAVRALVLVPSKELGQQVVLSLRQLAAFCAREVRVADICAHTDLAAQKPVLMERPEVVVGTPGRVLAHLEARSLVLRHSLELLVLDEADLLLSFGFGDDLKGALRWVEAGCWRGAGDGAEGHPRVPRCHVITQFNRGLYDYIVATDEEALEAPAGQPPQKKRKGAADSKGKDPEYSVARGIDFQNVATVINFDVPPTVESYIHRVGRTARADNPGTALTFVLPEEWDRLAQIEDRLAGENGRSMLQPYKFCMEEIEGLRYRCRDAMRSVTKQAVKEARLREIKEELLNSEKLKTYFEDNPRDLHVLRHDKPLHPAIVKPHLRNVPDYLVPPSLRGIAKPNLKKHKRLRLPHAGARRRGGPTARRNANPLQSFKYTRQRAKHRAAKSS